MAGQPLKIMIVDDHAIVREGLRMLLGDEPGLAIIAEAGDAETAIDLVKAKKPDVILLDVALPGRDGISAAKTIAALPDAPKIVLLTSSLADDLRLQEALDAGVVGYLLKDVSKADLVRALKNAHAGAPAFHPEVQRQLLRRATGARLAHESLTAREREILIEIARGKSNKVIAYDLGLTEGTVKGHVSTVLAKLGVDDRTQAALYAVKHGLAKI
ncbi:MAG: response regulator transcription factor [Amphiplicatus sp.]|jgi:DNA-binding NarL/FixJ family response regulator